MATNVTKSWLKLQLIIWKILYHNPSSDPWNWLRRVLGLLMANPLPIEEFGFTLHKGAFRDAIAFRYEWPSPRIPVSCDCGSWNLLYRAQKVDFHHFAITRSGTCLLTCYQKFAMTSVSNPAYNHFQQRQLNGASSNVQDGAHLDIVANGFWGVSLREFILMFVSLPLGSLSLPIQSLHLLQEARKSE